MATHPHPHDRGSGFDPSGDTATRARIPPQMTVGTRWPQPLPSLLKEVQRARAALRDVRHDGGAAPARVGQTDLFNALTAYTAALSTMRFPVPYAIRDELCIYRNLLTTYGGSQQAAARSAGRTATPAAKAGETTHPRFPRSGSSEGSSN